MNVYLKLGDSIDYVMEFSVSSSKYVMAKDCSNVNEVTDIGKEYLSMASIKHVCYKTFHVLITFYDGVLLLLNKYVT